MLGYEEFKEMIYKSAIEGIMKMYKYSEETATKLVNESGLNVSILLYPEMVAHCSQEQLVDMVI